jgi:NTE family protein
MVAAASHRVAAPTLREWLREAPFSLSMSSGFFAFFAHTGLLSVLADEGYLPSRVSGSSAGALVTGAWAAGVEPDALAHSLLTLKRSDFWDPGLGLGLLRGRLFRQKLEAMLPVRTFDQARVPLAISVFDALTAETEVLTSGDLAPAICASCAVPGLFHPVRIGRRFYFDGGIKDRPGILGIPHHARTFFHHIVSRSPWRRVDSEAMTIPQRPNMTTLVIEELPRSGPFRLEAGRRAYDVARTQARLALGQKVERSQVRI